MESPPLSSPSAALPPTIAKNGATPAGDGEVDDLPFEPVARGSEASLAARAAIVLDLDAAEREASTGAGVLTCRRCGGAAPALPPVAGTGFVWGRCPSCAYVSYLDT
jgi:hypothetical protein